ncbi:hypothetical protein ACP0AK_10400 [Listeria ivanovii]|uniref:Uncharacterized protein n=1 Tax=Listeria ivanovii (strain ATCC BAA-678 / PAM 55) TaxID=881621 RepID=G2Z974_LISIP|nr:hypothetical protein [Listeria ivanovii]AHI57159.1 hypothetical protein AX25_14245 [Listeria ivanovii WSLC3009]MBC1759746.1 hypothetical protein [Listeria ivanovii]MBK3914879.1 hypothetical protein [Listeria ivanovii subsp. ivanovii]MBK3921961.1 hypothetical protein [Listeria ivanovii subsp. ivanovii]MBK3927168.1 hypothetical protein [Listeria ivanovii subsp. ivanovii]
MAVKRDMPEESKNSKVVKKEHFSIVFPDDIKVPKSEKELEAEKAENKSEHDKTN